MNALLLALAILASPTSDTAESLPFSDLKIHDWGVEIIGSDGIHSDHDYFVFDTLQFGFAMEEDGPLTIDDCLWTAQQACPHGIKRFYFRAEPYTCEFECFPGTGGGG